MVTRLLEADDEVAGDKADHRLQRADEPTDRKKDAEGDHSNALPRQPFSIGFGDWLELVAHRLHFSVNGCIDRSRDGGGELLSEPFGNSLMNVFLDIFGRHTYQMFVISILVASTAIPALRVVVPGEVLNAP